ncbi:hypothetical protein ANCCAN_27739 [Ancylostoma caninum]|uniref:Uncharacterized protein n=1 Tax=Ancylostoma caninum TaxID=29170 RepID=A0A368F355_ANCCA|nr:hypothetical protein ANCCAN_27739 [Ancylostoma caninum]
MTWLQTHSMWQHLLLPRLNSTRNVVIISFVRLLMGVSCIGTSHL